MTSVCQHSLRNVGVERLLAGQKCPALLVDRNGDGFRIDQPRHDDMFDTAIGIASAGIQREAHEFCVFLDFGNTLDERVGNTRRVDKLNSAPRPAARHPAPRACNRMGMVPPTWNFYNLKVPSATFSRRSWLTYVLPDISQRGTARLQHIHPFAIPRRLAPQSRRASSEFVSRIGVQSSCTATYRHRHSGQFFRASNLTPKVSAGRKPDRISKTKKSVSEMTPKICRGSQNWHGNCGAQKRLRPLNIYPAHRSVHANAGVAAVPTYPEKDCAHSSARPTASELSPASCTVAMPSGGRNINSRSRRFLLSSSFGNFSCRSNDIHEVSRRQSAGGVTPVRNRSRVVGQSVCSLVYGLRRACGFPLACDGREPNAHTSGQTHASAPCHAFGWRGLPALCTAPQARLCVIGGPDGVPHNRSNTSEPAAARANSSMGIDIPPVRRAA